MKRIIFLLLFILFSTNFLPAQVNADSIINYSTKSFEHSLAFFSSPLNYEEDEWNDVIKVTAATSLSFLIDKEVKKFMLDVKHRSDFQDKISKIDRYYGNTRSAVIIIGGTFFTGLVIGNNEIMNAGIMLSESVIFSNIITQSLKMLTGRERPDETNNNFHFIGPNLGFDKFQALPSGHSTTSFAISTVAAGLTDNVYLKILFYSPAFLTSLSRIYNNRHWLSDVLLGGLVGYYTGKKVLSLNGKSTEDTITLNFDGRSIELSIKF